MRLGGEVDYDIAGLHQPGDDVAVADVTFHEAEAGIVADLIEIGGVAGVGQLVEDGHRVLGVLAQREPDVLASDEACPAGDQQSHAIAPANTTMPVMSLPRPSRCCVNTL